MKLKIKSQPAYINQFCVNVFFYHGDMDAVSNEKIRFYKESETIEFLKELEKLGYSYRPGRSKDLHSELKLVKEKLIDNEKWPVDSTYPEENTAFYKYEVTYFNPSGVELSVDVLKK